MEAITPYGEMGGWIKGKTKTGEDQELPLPTQLMPWIEAWKAIRRTDRPNPYLFPGEGLEQPISSELVRLRWSELRARLGIQGLWNYDIRRTFAMHMSNELGYDDSTIRAILKHHDTSALSHYRFKSFDSLTKPIQRYADWLWSLKDAAKGEILEPAPMPPAGPVDPGVFSPVSGAQNTAVRRGPDNSGTHSDRTQFTELRARGVAGVSVIGAGAGTHSHLIEG